MGPGAMHLGHRPRAPLAACWPRPASPRRPRCWSPSPIWSGGRSPPPASCGLKSRSCASEPLELDDYVKSLDDAKLVVDMLVGDLQRVIEYPKQGFAVAQDVPEDVHAAYESLIRAGFTSRLIS